MLSGEKNGFVCPTSFYDKMSSGLYARKVGFKRGDWRVGRCTELCTKDTTGSCALCTTLAERDRFERLWFKGGWFIEGAHAMQRRGVFTLLHRYAFPFCFLMLGGLLHLWFAWRATGPYFVHDNAVFVVVLVISLGMPLLWLVLWWLPQWQVAAVPEEKERIDLETKSRQTMAQILGGAALLGGLFFTAQTLRISQEGLQVNQETLRINQQTLQITQEGQITERFTKAIDQLGKPGEDNLAVRLGGIYALERIARDSTKDHGPIMEVLTAFVREQTHVQKTTPAKPSPASGESSDQERAKVPADIQAILTVLGRRTRTYGKGESQPLDLSRAQLQGAILAGAQLQGAILWEAQLQKADLREVKNLTQGQINQACVDEHTKLPEEPKLTPPAPCPVNVKP